MKTKSISKIISVLFALVMTICLTSCEDESVPAYGTGVESDGSVHHNLSPNPHAETESETGMVEGYIRGCGVGYDDEVGEYIWVTAFVTSHYPEKTEMWRLVNISVYDDEGWPVKKIILTNPPDKSYDLDAIVKPETPAMLSETFILPDNSNYVTITLQDATGETDDVVLDTIQSYLTEN